MSSEFERIANLARLFGAASASPPTSIARGIGDDAAVLDATGRAGRLVWTVDAQVEGVHFRTDFASWADVGWRSFMAAASDLAAMGASPWCALAALVLPGSVDDEALRQLSEGQAEAALATGAPIVGGNLACGGEASITTTLLGTAVRPLERIAARGDGIWVAGPLGLAAAGFAALEQGLDRTDAEVARALRAWRRPTARIGEGIAIAQSGEARGAIDVSDGLAQDVGHVARACSLRAVLDERAVRAYAAPLLGELPRRLGVPLLDLVLHGGEDYALVAACDHALEGFVRIGRFEEGEGVALEAEDGTARVVDARGFDHFR